MKIIGVIGTVGAVIAAVISIWNYSRTVQLDKEIHYEHMQHLKGVELNLCSSLLFNEDDCPSRARPQYENVSRLGNIAHDVYFLYSEISEYNMDCGDMPKDARMERILDMFNQTTKITTKEELVFTKNVIKVSADKGGYFITSDECLKKLKAREMKGK